MQRREFVKDASAVVFGIGIFENIAWATSDALPDFPGLKDDDVHAIFMYLKTIKPVKNIVPAPVTPDKM